MRSHKHKLLCLVLSLALMAGLVPTAAFAQQPMNQPVVVDLQDDRPCGILPEWPLASGEPLDLPTVLADPAEGGLQTPDNLDTLFGYSQLTSEGQRTFYKALYTAVRQAEAGRPMPFQLDIPLPEAVTSNDLFIARELYLNDMPLDSWIVDYCNAYSYGSNAYLQMIGHPDYDKQAFDTEFAKLLQAAEGKTTDYEKALALHDALADHVTYDQDAFERQEQDIRHPTFHAYGAVVDHLCVCDGYAHAYQALLNAVGIPAFRITGMQHAWNMVVLDGKYYYTDVTWDDMDETFHTYFNVPYNVISQDHTPYPDRGYMLPADANPDDMSMMYHKMVFTDNYTAAQAEMAEKVADLPARHKKTVELYFTGAHPSGEAQAYSSWSQSGGAVTLWEKLCGPAYWRTHNMLSYSFHRGRILLFSEVPDSITISLPAQLDAPLAAPNQQTWAQIPCTIQRTYQGGEALTDVPERLEIKSAQGSEGIQYVNGTVKVSNKAAAGVYDMNFFVDGITASCQLEITKQAPEMASAELSDGVDQIAVPRPGQSPSAAKNAFKITAYDQYGLPMPLPAGSVQWSVDPAAGAAIDPATGILTVTDQAKPGKLTVTAVVTCSGRTQTLTHSVLATQDTSVVAELKIDGKYFLTIPASGEVKESYTVTAVDANGHPVSLDPTLLKWALEPASYGVNLTPVDGTVNAVLTLTHDAETQSPTLMAQYGDQLAKLSLILQREPPVLSSVRYFEGDMYHAIEKTAVALPENGPAELVLYAETNDQYGTQMSGQFMWGLTGPAADKVDLVSIPENDPAFNKDYLCVRLTFPAGLTSGEYQLSLRQGQDGKRFVLPITVTAHTQPQPDKTQLNQLIQQSAGKQAHDYTKGSFATLTNALEKARAVSADPKATEQQISAETAALTDALNQLNSTYSWQGSLSLTDRIGINLYGDFSPALAKDAVVVVTVGEDESIRVPVASAPMTYYGYKFTTSVSVRQMTDPITIQVMQGNHQIGQTLHYSVRQYAENALANQNETVCQLVKAMLLHGQRMQIFKNYHTERLAGADLDLAALETAAEAVTPESLDAYQPRQQGKLPDGITLHGVSLELADRTTLKYYFRLQNGKTAGDYTFTANGKPVAASQNGESVVVSVNGISASHLDDTVDFAVSDGTDTLHIFYSPLTYARSAISAHLPAEPVARSLVVFNQAANRYADKK